MSHLLKGHGLTLLRKTFLRHSEGIKSTRLIWKIITRNKVKIALKKLERKLLRLKDLARKLTSELKNLLEK
jgi:hypothetical protein